MDENNESIKNPFYFSTSREITGLRVQDLEYDPNINAKSIPHQILPSRGFGRRDTHYPLINTQFGEVVVKQQKDIITNSIFKVLGTISHYAFEMVCIDILSDVYNGNGIQTPRTGDGGIDGVIYCREPYQQTYLMQCKQYSSPVGVSEIEEFVLDSEIWCDENSDEAESIFIALNGYTESARSKAEDQQMCLFTGHELAELALKYNRGIESVEFPLLDRLYWEDLANVK